MTWSEAVSAIINTRACGYIYACTHTHKYTHDGAHTYTQTSRQVHLKPAVGWQALALNEVLRHICMRKLTIVFCLLTNLWNSEVQCHIHKGSPVIPILSRINSIPHIDTYLFKVHSNIVLPSTPRPHQRPLSFL